MRVLVDKVIRMRVGASFFVEEASAEAMAFLRRPVVKAGANVRIREVDCDEIYQCHGVRVWRLEGPYDEL